jgi:glycosyltransferase 2 family protein
MNIPKAVVRAAAGLTISGVSIYLVTQAISVGGTAEVLGRARWEAIVFTVGLLAGDIVIRGLRWRGLLAPIAELPRLTVLAHLLVGYLANNVLPARLGEAARAFSLGDREGLSRTAVIGSVVVERLLDIGVLAVAVFIGVAFVTSASAFVLAAVTGLLVGAGGLVIAFVIAGMGPHRRWLDRVPAGRVRSILHGLINGLSVIRSAGALTQAIILTAIAWAVTGTAFSAAGSAVGLHLSIPEALLFAAAVNLATAIPAGPGYVGTFELAAISVSAAIGISPVTGLAMGVIVHIATLFLTTLGGAASLAGLYLRPVGSGVRARRTSENVMAVVRESNPDENA